MHTHTNWQTRSPLPATEMSILVTYAGKFGAGEISEAVADPPNSPVQDLDRISNCGLRLSGRPASLRIETHPNAFLLSPEEATVLAAANGSRHRQRARRRQAKTPCASTVQQAEQDTRYAMRNAEGAASLPAPAAESLDTVRALCHDLRQPLATIRLLAGAACGDDRQRFDGILEEAQWLSEMVEAVIGGAADDLPGELDVIDLVERCVHRARATATCHIGFVGTDRATVLTSPVALGRAIGCVLDNAVRAAGPGGQVNVEVTGTGSEVSIRVIDDGPGLGHVPINNVLGLTITRALVSACGGGFRLEPGPAGGAVARIVLPALTNRSAPT